MKRLWLTVYEGVQCGEHWSLRASVRCVLQLLGGRGGLGQAAGLQRGHGGAGGVVGAHVLLVACSAVLEPHLHRQTHTVLCRAAFDGNKHKHVYQRRKSGNLNLAERRLELGRGSRVWTCPGGCWRNHCQQWKLTPVKHSILASLKLLNTSVNMNARLIVLGLTCAS